MHVLAAVEAGLLQVAIDAEVVQEILYRDSHIGLAEKGIQLASALLAYRPSILPLGETEIQLALDIFDQHRNQGVGPRDALHAAVMLSNQLLRIVSTDCDFERIPGITRIDPRDV